MWQLHEVISNIYIYILLTKTKEDLIDNSFNKIHLNMYIYEHIYSKE